VGKERLTDGLLIAWPAATFSLRSWMKRVRSGGQEQGTRINCPLAPVTAPSQFPVPSGFGFGLAPKSSTSDGSTSGTPLGVVPKGAEAAATGDAAGGAAADSVAHGAAITNAPGKAERATRRVVKSIVGVTRELGLAETWNSDRWDIV